MLIRGVIVTFHEQKAIQKIVNILEKSCIIVRGTAVSGNSTLRLISPEDGGGVLVCGSQFTDMSSKELLNLLPEDYDMLLLSTKGAGAERADGLYTLSLPLRADDLVSSVKMLLETRQLSSDYSRRKQLEKKNVFSVVEQRDEQDQRLIEKAKTLLMNRNNMSEEETHYFLQKKSMDSGTKILEIARNVLKEGYLDV